MLYAVVIYAVALSAGVVLHAAVVLYAAAVLYATVVLHAAEVLHAAVVFYAGALALYVVAVLLALYAAVVPCAALVHYAAVVLNAAVVVPAPVLLRHCDKLFKRQQRKLKQVLMLVSATHACIPSQSKDQICSREQWNHHRNGFQRRGAVNAETVHLKPSCGAEHLCPTTKQLPVSCLTRLLNKSRQGASYSDRYCCCY